ncbi:MAG: hypothetical protein ABI760_14335 [Ferruginibacter sp.]
MFNSITWGQYFSTLVLLLVCYFAYIRYPYYWWEILGIISIKKFEDNAVGSSELSTFKNLIVTESLEDYLPKPDPIAFGLEIDISPLVDSFS